MVGEDTFGDLLRRFRTQAGLTQEELAERAGLSVRGISALERGINRAPYRATVQQVISALGLQGKEAEELWASASRRRGPAPTSSELGHWCLPVPPTSIVGREREVGTVLHLLRWEGHRLITLTGTAGVGKTRLALEVAQTVAAEYADGAAFVSLATISDPELVPSAVAVTLGVRPAGTATPEQSLQRYLAERELLLVLDNLEQVLPAGLFVAALLAGSPRVKVLSTSRAPLQIRGEQQVEVPPLEVPLAGQWVSADSLSRYAAVALFLQRARAVQPGLQPTDEQAGAIAEICRRLDGLPLAIELAAAQVKYHSPQTLVVQLAHRLDVLTGGARDLPTRQQTMRDTIAWSYQLLDAEEQSLFRALAVFSGGCTRAAVESVWVPSNGGSRPVLPVLQSLIATSLLVLEEGADTETRYRMLETTREYAEERLAEDEQREMVYQRHADFYLALAEEAAQHLTGAEQAGWVDRLELEHDNLRGVLRRAEERGDATAGMRLAGWLWRFWEYRGYRNEGQRWLQTFLGMDAERSAAPIVRAWALVGAGTMAYYRSELADAAALLEESRILFRELENAHGLATALSGLGTVAVTAGRYAEAVAFFDECLEVRRGLPDPHELVSALNNLANARMYQGEMRRAAALYQEALAEYQRTGQTRATAVTLANLGDLVALFGEYERASELLQESLLLYRELRSASGMALALNNLGSLALQLGDAQTACAHFSEGLELYQSIGDIEGAAMARINLGDARREQGEYALATELLTEGLAVLRAGENERLASYAYMYLGDVDREQGAVDRAQFEYRKTLRVFQKIGFKWGIGECLERMAWLLAAAGDANLAATLGGAAEGLQEAMGVILAPSQRSQHDEMRRRCEDAGSGAYWDTGYSLGAEEAIRRLLSDSSTTPPIDRESTHVDIR